MNQFTVFVLATAGTLLLQVPGKAATPDSKGFLSADVSAAKNDDAAA